MAVFGALYVHGRSTPKLDPTTGVVAQQRQAAIDSISQASTVVGTQLGAASSLGARTDTACVPGDKGWPHNDDDLYRSECWVEVTTAYAVDVPPLPALGALDAPLAAVGWAQRGGRFPEPNWSLTAGRGAAESFEAFTRGGYQLEDLEAVGYVGPRQASLSIQPRHADFAVPEPKLPLVPQHGLGSYFATTQGVDWQIDWAQQRTSHSYVVIVTGSLTFAEQRW
jgi:hypothetical protein